MSPSLFHMSLLLLMDARELKEGVKIEGKIQILFRIYLGGSCTSYKRSSPFPSSAKTTFTKFLPLDVTSRYIKKNTFSRTKVGFWTF